jgi:hypothetical protein
MHSRGFVRQSMTGKQLLSLLSLAAPAIILGGCKTPAQVYEEKEVRQQPIVVDTKKQGPTPVAEVVKGAPSAFAGKTLTIQGVVSGIMNPNALTLRGPGPDLLVLIPGHVALAPGRTSTQPWKMQDSIQVTGTIQTFGVAQLAPGLYALVPPSSRSAWANRPVMIASDLVYLDMSYDAVGVGPTGVKVAKGAITATPPPTLPHPKKVVDMRTPVPVLDTLGEITGEANPRKLIGYRVRLDNATISKLVGPSTFYLGTAPHRVLCVIGEVNSGKPYTGGIELRDGKSVDLEGKVDPGGVKGLHVWKQLSKQEVREIEAAPILVWISYLRN